MVFKILFLIVPALYADDCTLLVADEAEKPSPSLIKCYRHNNLACCKATHDEKILGDYESMFSSNCQREYNELEDFFCYGCNPDQGEYIDVENKILYFCEDYLERIWGDDLDEPTGRYDNCAMNTFWRGDNSTTVMPSVEWQNAFDFFTEVKPPYFEDYTIVIVEGDGDCFNMGELLALTAATLLLA